MQRRDVLKTAAAASLASPLLQSPNLQASEAASSLLKGQAEHVISIWLGGGMGAMDTFDPKRLGDPAKKVAGSYYPGIDTCVPGVQVCEHLSKMAPLMDRVTAVRTVNHQVIDEHAAATNFMHTGRPVSGTVVYPSLGSIVAHERGAVADDAPPYVLIGYPNVTRGPGFLGAKDGYLYLTDTSQGPTGLSRPEYIEPERQSRRRSILQSLRQMQNNAHLEAVKDYESAIDLSLQLSGPSFNQSFELDKEPADLRNQYGGEFGQRCLLSRRLVERGVRFIEVSHNLNFINGTGWDVHNAGIQQQHTMIQELDTAVGTLLLDLEQKHLLDKTLIVITTEFGRPPEFDAGGGRGHQGSAFTCVLAGGGLNHQGAYGLTDEIGKKIVENPVSVPDFFATIHASLGIDYTKYLYDGDRPVPVTDQGRPIAKLFA
ncbi:MAG: DUF1501 domain-containing protein [Rubinisphaera brasiliensis]|uniref:DUF1501 domain-containing protein n=1 Tax=Rubinisphaera brasiliensis (strain ATCC 49424 / DSM 5305 / JCM 21570 / IAM 15109 / NBRC 103401 / IFAM 1448) TaxID=756272 RepID=F0SIW3_RUBBR|nr:DUF1501 domain-containing protein [Rubinisphaera brasiliensis]ADY61812.1 protein of unknown function DUF1501 [Rubinisphaera brasiliensis DSM 5305]